MRENSIREFLMDKGSFIEDIGFEKIGETEAIVRIERVKSGMYRLNWKFDLRENTIQDDWKIEITPAFKASFNWAPHLTPEEGMVIDQHCFRSPALMAGNDDKILIVVPDLEMMNEEPANHWYMDMDAQENRLVLGMCKTAVEGHVLYRKISGATYEKGEHEFGCYLFLVEDEEKVKNPFRDVLDFLWKQYGRKLYRAGEPISGELDHYIKYTYDWAFKNWANSVWQEFEIDGNKVGAPTFIVNVTQSPNFPGAYTERETKSIWNQAWFSSLRSAIGLYKYAKATEDQALLEKANLIKELALSFPQRKGIFPSVIATEMETVRVGGQTVRRSKGWSSYYWGNSDRNPYSSEIGNSPYHILDMSWTCFLMLRWYEELEKDNRLLQYARNYGDALLKLQDEKGFFPAWLDGVTMRPMAILAQSPETSLSVTFLLKLYGVTREDQYLHSALRAMDAVNGHIIQEGRWEDFETYWSCSSYGQKDLVGKKVERNNLYKQCNFSMYWTAEALYNSFMTTNEKRYLDLGQRCLDEMLMTQASWQPPFIPVSTLGGFGVMNCDGEWNDARQSLFSKLIVQYGLLVDKEEYIERGIAALRASFVMMYCPENQKTKTQWERKWPFFREEDYGFMMENYGHLGTANQDGTGMGEFTIFDWGNGAAVESYMGFTEIADQLLTRPFFPKKFLKTE